MSKDCKIICMLLFLGVCHIPILIVNLIMFVLYAVLMVIGYIVLTPVLLVGMLIEKWKARNEI